MTVRWDGYQPAVPTYAQTHATMTRAQARSSFEEVMASRPERAKQLGALLEANGVRLGGSDEDLRAVEDWFRAEVEPGDEPGRLRPLWYAVVHDLGLLLGEELIRRHPTLRWELFTGGKRDISYHKPVVAGFTKVANPRYNIDPDRLVATYGYQLVGGQAVEPGFFDRLLRSAADKA